MIDYKAKYETLDPNAPALETIFKLVLNEEFDSRDYVDQAIDALKETFRYWWENKVRNEQQQLRKKILKPYLNTCEKCGKINCQTELHHVVSPIFLGGNEKENLLILCKDCHKETMKREVKQ